MSKNQPKAHYKTYSRLYMSLWTLYSYNLCRFHAYKLKHSHLPNTGLWNCEKYQTSASTSWSEFMLSCRSPLLITILIINSYWGNRICLMGAPPSLTNFHVLGARMRTHTHTRAHTCTHTHTRTRTHKWSKYNLQQFITHLRKNENKKIKKNAEISVMIPFCQKEKNNQSRGKWCSEKLLSFKICNKTWYW